MCRTMKHDAATLTKVGGRDRPEALSSSTRRRLLAPALPGSSTATSSLSGLVSDLPRLPPSTTSLDGRGGRRPRRGGCCPPPRRPARPASQDRFRPPHVAPPRVVPR